MEWLKIKGSKSNPLLCDSTIIQFSKAETSPKELILKIKNSPIYKNNNKNNHNNDIDKLLHELQIMNNTMLEINNDIEQAKRFIEIAKVKQTLV